MSTGFGGGLGESFEQEFFKEVSMLTASLGAEIISLDDVDFAKE